MVAASAGSSAAIRVEPYGPERREEWDDFVQRAKNGVFLFLRDYMDYHSDRFQDASLLVFSNERLVSILPANREGGTVLSHGGLTFGGFLTGARMTQALALAVFEGVVEHLRREAVEKVIYKPIPHIYHGLPAEEDLYALHRLGARLARRDVSSTLSPGKRPPLTKGRKWAGKRARTAGVTVQGSDAFGPFMRLEEEQLQARYGVHPTHTAAEIELLARRFPENIRLMTAEVEGRLVGGVLVYESSQVAHAQYIATTDEGRDLGALDALVGHLLEEVYAAKPWFDFGISTVDQGRVLNEGLAANKESFGARSVVYDTYELDIS